MARAAGGDVASNRLPSAALAAAASVYLCIVAILNEHVPEAYMDEPFHVTQTQAYCHGAFHVWDDKITTFPGLYLLGTAYAWASWLLLASWRGIPLEQVCQVQYLRALNALLSILCLYLFFSLVVELQEDDRPVTVVDQQQVHQTHKDVMAHGSAQHSMSSKHSGRWCTPAPPVFTALVLAMFPLHAFYSALYYTDVGALAALLATYLLLLQRQLFAATGAAVLAVGFRQTNAVWVAFLLGTSILRDIYAAEGRRSSSDSSEGGGTSLMHGVGQEISLVLPCIWRMRRELMARYWMVALVPAAFVAFVCVNGGITVGDRAAHVPVFHAMQLNYCALFIACTTAPLLLGVGAVQNAARAVQQGWTRQRGWFIASLAVVIAILVACVTCSSLAHPYLLADNRHYTFYVWRRWFAQSLSHRLTLVPAYIVAWVVLSVALHTRRSTIWCLGLLMCTAVTLIPAWLLEFRYYTVPYVLVVLNLPVPPRWAATACCGAYMMVNLATLFMFVKHPFQWPDGSTARFMW